MKQLSASQKIYNVDVQYSFPDSLRNDVDFTIRIKRQNDESSIASSNKMTLEKETNKYNAGDMNVLSFMTPKMDTETIAEDIKNIIVDCVINPGLKRKVDINQIRFKTGDEIYICGSIKTCGLNSKTTCSRS